MTDEREQHDEFDHYTVDTRRQARWTESRRHAPDPSARRAAGSREQGDPRAGDRLPEDPAERPLDRTRAMPAVDPGPAARPAAPPARPASRSARPAARPAPVVPGGPSGPRRPATGASPVAPPRRRRVRWWRLLPLLLVLWLAFLVVTPLHAWSTVHRADTTPGGDRPTNAGGHNYLLLGSDSRVGLSDEERAKLGASQADGARTDSIILVHVPGHGGKASLISVPRDSYVPIPGHGSHKINAAYSLGGAALLTQTLEQVGGIGIDGTFEIGFAGFADVVDSVGGVTLCPKWDMKDPEAGLDVKKGCQTMNGPTALGYVRTRHTDPRGDLGRADRQREFLGALMKAAVTPSTVLLPWRYWGFTHSAAGAVQMSSNLGMGDAFSLLQTMRGTGSGDTLSLMMPISSMGYPTSDGSAVKWNSEQARALFQMIHDDTPMETAPAGTNG